MQLPLCWVEDWLVINIFHHNIKIDQFIHLNTNVALVKVWVTSSYNNSPFSHWIRSSQLGCVTCHFFCIEEHPDSLSIVGSNVVQHNMAPSGWFVGIWVEPSVWQKDTEPEKRQLLNVHILWNSYLTSNRGISDPTKMTDDLLTIH